MVQVINDPNRQSFGQSLSTALSSALGGLAQHKIGQMQAKQQQAKTAQGLQALLGVPAHEAHGLALLDPKILEEAVKYKLAAPAEEAAAKSIGLGGPVEQGSQSKGPVRIKPEQAIKIAQLNESRQQNINKENQAFIERIVKKAEPQRELRKDAIEAKRLLNLRNEKGERIAQVGGLRSLTPSRAQNEVTQALVGKLNRLVIEMSETGKGVPHRARLALEQLSKPAIWQKPAAIEYQLNQLVEGTREGLATDEARKQILEEHNNIQPRGFENLVEKRAKLIKDLPAPEEYSEDAVIKVRGYEWERTEDGWKFLGKSGE